MLTVSQVSKSFAGRVLFEDVSLQVNRGDRIGLVGPNGAGKSTLFSLILGDASPDSGKVSLEKSATLGYLPQETAAAETSSTAMAISPSWSRCSKIELTQAVGRGYHERFMFSTSTAAGSSNRKRNASWPAWLFAKAISRDRPAR